MSTDPVGATVRAHRARLRLSQVELAALADVSRPTIARIEGGHAATAATLERIGGPLGLPPRWYLDPDRYMPPALGDAYDLVWTIFRFMRMGPSAADLALIEALVVARERAGLASHVDDAVAAATLSLRRLAKAAPR